MSKAALNACGKSLALDLAPRGVSVIILHPGFVRTDMTGQNGLVDTKESATGLLARIDELNAESSGSFRHMNGEALDW
jgi:NAD(P)-dependent dehydrogenase (short-subunit alcohol dehydrogenase family)